jgi:hypothetical protein
MGFASFVGSLFGVPAPRGDVATVVSAGEQYKEFLAALAAVKRKYRMKELAHHHSIAELTASCVGRKGVVLLEGKQLTVSVRLAGSELITELETSGKFALPIDVVVKSALHLPGLGMEMRFMGGKELVFDRLAIRPEFQKDSPRTKKALKPVRVRELGQLIFLKPKTMNLSSQLGEFYEKKLTVLKDRVFVRDYGLPRDEKYLRKLASSLLDFAAVWRKAR